MNQASILSCIHFAGLLLRLTLLPPPSAPPKNIFMKWYAMTGGVPHALVFVGQTKGALADTQRRLESAMEGIKTMSKENTDLAECVEAVKNEISALIQERCDSSSSSSSRSACTDLNVRDSKCKKLARHFGPELVTRISYPRQPGFYTHQLVKQLFACNNFLFSDMYP